MQKYVKGFFCTCKVGKVKMGMPCCIKCRPNICHFFTKAFQRDRTAIQAKIDVFFCCKQTTTMIKKKLNVAMICINNMQIFYTTAQKLYPLITKAECFFPFPYHNSLPRKECHFNIHFDNVFIFLAYTHSLGPSPKS